MKEVLKKYKLDDVKHVSTPMILNTKLDIDLSGKSMLGKVYRSMIGSLFYPTVNGLDVCLVYAYALGSKVPLKNII